MAGLPLFSRTSVVYQFFAPFQPAVAPAILHRKGMRNTETLALGASLEFGLNLNGSPPDVGRFAGKSWPWLNLWSAIVFTFSCPASRTRSIKDKGSNSICWVWYKKSLAKVPTLDLARGMDSFLPPQLPVLATSFNIGKEPAFWLSYTPKMRVLEIVAERTSDCDVHKN